MNDLDAFATLILMYVGCTLPPASESHVLMWLGIFSCSGTAQNYVGYVARTCRCKWSQQSPRRSLPTERLGTLNVDTVRRHDK